MEFELLPEDIDAIDGVPLPRHTDRLLGHESAERAFLEAFRASRLPHAWLICGPEGIGKATLAFRIARFVLKHADPALVRNPADLSIPADDPVARKIARLAHPDLFLLRRMINPDSGKIRGEISVHDTRELLHRFQTTSAAQGWRVAIVDSADDLNRNAANALLKMLEEPPPRALFLIVAHRPAGLLPTVRSRCRHLVLDAPSDEVVTTIVADLMADADASVRAQAIRRAGGSPRRALQLLSGSGIETIAAVEGLLDQLPKIDLRVLHRLADQLARKDRESEFTLFYDTLATWVAARLRDGAERGQGTAALARLAEAAAAISQARATAEVFNLDRRQTVVTAVTDLAVAMGRRPAA
jgi:DNA polymerase-3 subunit delta'